MLDRRTDTSSQIEYADLQWAYRLLLGREPDDMPNLLEQWRKAVPDIRSLVDAIARSDEFCGQRQAAPHFGYNVDPIIQAEIAPMLQRLAPFSVKGFSKIRVGNTAMEGAVMLDDFDGVDAAYSLGTGLQLGWEYAIADSGVEVYRYDHATEAHHERERFHARRIGIVGSATDDPGLDTLDNQLGVNGHGRMRNLILKCDLEGAEWELLEATGAAPLQRFRQIVIEVHFLQALHDRRFASLAATAIAHLTENHRVVHVHGNNCAAYSIVGGIALPSVLELTLVRIGDGKVFRPSDECFPTGLDVPHLAGRSDYRLGTFRFY